MIPCGSLVFHRVWLRLATFGLAAGLACGGMVLAPARASADEMTCGGIKRALVSANRELMRIERGPLPVAPEQAALAIGQMTALENIAAITCSPDDADKIAAVVNPRVDGLQHLLPAAPTEEAEGAPASDQTAETPPPNAAAAGVDPPTPPSRPAATDNPEPRRRSVSAASCNRAYYMKGNHRMWRCKR